MLKAQQEAIDANPDYEFYSLNIDAGGMWVRRLIERHARRPRAAWRRPPERPTDDRGIDNGSNQHRSLAAGDGRRRPRRGRTASGASYCEPAAPEARRAGLAHRCDGHHRRRQDRSAPTPWWSPTTAATAWPSASSRLRSLPRRIGLHARARSRVTSSRSPSRCRTSRCGSAPSATSCWPAASASPRSPHMAARPAQRRGRLHAGLRRPQPRPRWRTCTSWQDLHGDRLRSTSTTRGTRWTSPSSGRRLDPGHRAVHVRADPADGCGPPRLGRTRAALAQPALRDLRQQRLVRRRRSSSSASRGSASRPRSGTRPLHARGPRGRRRRT